MRVGRSPVYWNSQTLAVNSRVTYRSRGGDPPFLVPARFQEVGSYWS
jgi:hypothetical protein